LGKLDETRPYLQGQEQGSAQSNLQHVYEIYRSDDTLARPFDKPKKKKYLAKQWFWVVLDIVRDRAMPP
jgi:hypothetical protein